MDEVGTRLEVLLHNQYNFGTPGQTPIQSNFNSTWKQHVASYKSSNKAKTRRGSQPKLNGSHKQHIEELTRSISLPLSYNLLYKQFQSLDFNLCLLKSRQSNATWAYTFKDLSRLVQNSTGRDFTLKHFQQILSLVPNFFMHKWEMQKLEPELLIEVPANIKDILTNPSISMSDFALEKQL